MSLTEVQCCVSVSHLCRCSSSSGRGPIHSNGRLSSFLLTHTSYTHTQPQTHLPPVRPTRSLTSSSACSWAECEFQEFRVLTAQIQQRERVLVMWEEEMGEEHILCLSLRQSCSVSPSTSPPHALRLKGIRVPVNYLSGHLPRCGGQDCTKTRECV